MSGASVSSINLQLQMNSQTGNSHRGANRGSSFTVNIGSADVKLEHENMSGSPFTYMSGSARCETAVNVKLSRYDTDVKLK